MITDAELIQHAAKALNNAYAPYTQKKFGAAILTTTNLVFTGCNIENASFGVSCCAERVAVYQAVNEGFRHFQSIAVVSTKEQYAFPCMTCQSVLAEFAPDIKIILQQHEQINSFSLSRLFHLTLMNNQRRLSQSD